MEISNLSDAEFKTLVTRMLKELSEDLSSIKKTQSETKDTLVKIKNNLQRNNSRLVKQRIKSMIWNRRKQKATKQKKKKELKKNEDSIRSLWDIHTYQHLNHRGARRSRGRARN